MANGTLPKRIIKVRPQHSFVHLYVPLLAIHGTTAPLLNPSAC